MRIRVVADVRRFGNASLVYAVQLNSGRFRRWKEIALFASQEEALTFAGLYATDHGRVIKELAVRKDGEGEY